MGGRGARAHAKGTRRAGRRERESEGGTESEKEDEERKEQDKAWIGWAQRGGEREGLLG